MNQLKAFVLFFFVVVVALIAYVSIKKEEEAKSKEQEPFKPEGFGLSMILPETRCDHYCT